MELQKRIGSIRFWIEENQSGIPNMKFEGVIEETTKREWQYVSTKERGIMVILT